MHISLNKQQNPKRRRNGSAAMKHRTLITCRKHLRNARREAMRIAIGTATALAAILESFCFAATGSIQCRRERVGKKTGVLPHGPNTSNRSAHLRWLRHAHGIRAGFISNWTFRIGPACTVQAVLQPSASSGLENRFCFWFEKGSNLFDTNESRRKNLYHWIKVFVNREGRMLEGAVTRHRLLTANYKSILLRTKSTWK